MNDEISSGEKWRSPREDERPRHAAFDGEDGRVGRGDGLVARGLSDQKRAGRIQANARRHGALAVHLDNADLPVHVRGKHRIRRAEVDATMRSLMMRMRGNLDLRNAQQLAAKQVSGCDLFHDRSRRPAGVGVVATATIVRGSKARCIVSMRVTPADAINASA